MREIIVTPKFNDKKLSYFLLHSFNNLNLNTFNKALRKKDIRINDVKITSNITVHCGDKVKVYIIDDLLIKKPKINIIYDDENVLIVHKPISIEVTGENSLTYFLKAKYSVLYPCHRLDMNTEGIVIFAKNENALNILLNMFKNHEIEKFYKCVVYGIPSKKHQILNSYLFKDSKNSVVYISDFPKKGYKNIITEYNVLSSNLKNNTSLLEIKLHTGRTHQIRAHLAHIGHPIIGDGKYGLNEVNKNFHQTKQNLCSYKIIFRFKSDAGILNYLNDKVFSIE